MEINKTRDNETKEQHAETMRKLNEHENTLLNMRFTWFTTLQGLLFASLGFIWKEHLQLVVAVICCMGIIVSLSFMAAYRMTRLAYDAIEKWWDENLKDYDGPPLKPVRMPKNKSLMRLLRPWRALPVVFIGCWVIILVYSFLS